VWRYRQAVARQVWIHGLPRISFFRGIAIYMYWDEGTHAAPHFHAHHGGKRASIDVDCKLIAGEIDQTAMRLVQRWAALHRDELLANWE
jgi:hypothetical protein